MAAYNLLRLANVACERCGRVGDRLVQFIYGAWRAAEYGVGDTLEWGGRPTEGARGLPEVVVQGILEGCPNCGYHPDTDYDIRINDDVIVSVEPSSGRYAYHGDAWTVLRGWD